MQRGQSIPTSDTPKVVIDQIGGDLRLVGWEQTQVTLMDEAEMTLEMDGETIYINGDDDCTLCVPHLASVTIRAVHGDATMSRLHGELQIEAIHGDARLHDLGSIVIGQVGGDLSARQVAQDLRAEHVGGDLQVAEVMGNCYVNGGGDLQIEQVQGNLHAHGGGDARLRLLLPPQSQSNINVGGDLHCHLPEPANVKIQATCGGEIRLKRIAESVRRSEQLLNLTLGTGEAMLNLHAGGDMRLLGAKAGGEEEGRRGRNFAAEDFGATIEFQVQDIAQQVIGQVERQMEHLTRHLDQRLAHFGNDEEFASRIQEKVQSAMRRAEEKMAEVMRRTEERVHAAEERATQRGPMQRPTPPWRPGQPPRPPQAGWPTPPPPPVAPQSPVVDEEERRTILRMVSEGKITVEQADQLLSALTNSAATARP